MEKTFQIFSSKSLGGMVYQVDFSDGSSCRSVLTGNRASYEYKIGQDWITAQGAADINSDNGRAAKELIEKVKEGIK